MHRIYSFCQRPLVSARRPPATPFLPFPPSLPPGRLDRERRPPDDCPSALCPHPHLVDSPVSHTVGRPPSLQRPQISRQDPPVAPRPSPSLAYVLLQPWTDSIEQPSQMPRCLHSVQPVHRGASDSDLHADMIRRTQTRSSIASVLPSMRPTPTSQQP